MWVIGKGIEWQGRNSARPWQTSLLAATAPPAFGARWPTAGRRPCLVYAIPFGHRRQSRPYHVVAGALPREEASRGRPVELGGKDAPAPPHSHLQPRVSCRLHLRSARRRGAGACTARRSPPRPTYPPRTLRLGRHSMVRLQVRRPTRPSASCHQPSKRSATSTWQRSWLRVARARSLRRLRWSRLCGVAGPCSQSCPSR